MIQLSASIKEEAVIKLPNKQAKISKILVWVENMGLRKG